MRHARQVLLFVVVACVDEPVLWARSSSPAQEASAAASAPDPLIPRMLIDESNAAREVGDYDGARAKAAKAVEHLLARPAAEQDAAWLELLNSAGVAAYFAQDARTANGAWERVYEMRLAVLPDDHPDLQGARQKLALTIKAMGDLAGARALEEKVLEVNSRTLPDDHPDLQWARGNLAATIKAQGDLAGARALFDKVLEVRSRTLPDDHADLQKARGNLAATIKAQGDLAGARALFEKVVEVLSRTLPDDHPDLQRARANFAETIRELGDLAGARALFEKVLEVRARTLPDDHPDLQAARDGLASTIKALGDLAGARALQEKVLEVFSRTLPDDHPDLQAAQVNLALTISVLGDLAGARALQEQTLEVLSRTLPGDHRSLQAARVNLAWTRRALGDLSGARALFEQVLEVYSRTLPADHPALQDARAGLAATLHMLGDLSDARALREKVLEVRSRTLPSDHPDLQAARLGLAASLSALGDLAGARALNEMALEVLSRTLPDDHPNLQVARVNLAATIVMLGDLVAARELLEKALNVRSRTLPDDHPDMQEARGGVAATLNMLGDLQGARALFEKVLEVYSRTLPDDHPQLQTARQNFAATIRALGDLAGARALQEKVLEVRSRTLPDDHPDLQEARGGLATTLYALGDFAGARPLYEKVLEVRSRMLPGDHPALQEARHGLALTIKALGDLAGALVLQEMVLEAYLRTPWGDHPMLQAARENLAFTIATQAARDGRTSAGQEERTSGRERRWERGADLIGALCRANVRAARAAIVESPGREAEERCSRLALALGACLSFARGFGVFEPVRVLESESFVLSETTRAAAIVSSELTRRAASAPKYADLRDSLSKASDELASLAKQGATSEAFDRARTAREVVERELVALARELSGGEKSGIELDVELLATRLAEREAAVSFRRFQDWRVEVVEELDATGEAAVRWTVVESLCAFVVRSTKAGSQDPSSQPSTLTLVDLGPIDAIEEAVRAWRNGQGVVGDSRGVAVGAREAAPLDVHAQDAVLRAKILDPLLPALAGAQRILVVLEDALHLLPLDALRLDDNTLIGDRWQIETRTTLTELLLSPAPYEGAGPLVAFGSVEYGAAAAEGDGGSPAAAESATELAAADVEPRAAEEAGILRGGTWAHGFSPLPGTGVEVRGIARCFADQFGADAERELCEHASATRERLFALAPRARYLHIATHGWFAPESIRSWRDPEPLDKHSGLGARMSGEAQVKGMSPMLLCGLAFAGANLPETATGRVPGLVTADELSTLDLKNCDLVVLSACDTNVGERRAGQGVASLQKALQMAGARSVITSLWKVPDEATKELMLDFYKRLWVEKKPKGQALWEAKKTLREAKDENSKPKYTTRDWAAWVLTGDPR